ncbi:MAG: hypothetical protein V1867_08025 [Candidatus Falkowbacteria bacterium]
MKIFILKKGCGIAVIRANDPDEAFKKLREYEKDPYLTSGKTSADLKEISDSDLAEVVGYFAN